MKGMSQRTADELEHRRGLVLGLTLAEVLLLLLFALLLALSWRMMTLQREVAAEHQKAQALAAQISRLEPMLGSLAPLLAELQAKGGLDLATVQQLAAKLIRVDLLEEENATLKRINFDLSAKLGTMRLIGSDLAKLKAIDDALAAAAKINANDPPEVLKRLGTETRPDQVTSLSELIRDREKLKALDNVIAAATQINPNDPPEALVRAVEILHRLGPDTQPDQVVSIEQQGSLVNQLNRVRRERDNLMRSGNGRTYPSCWTTADGQTEYIFDITIQDFGLIVKDATPSRTNDPAIQLVTGFARNELIKENLFSSGTTRLFKYSQEQNCRFYSIVRDGTGPTSKARYKQLRTLVEGHFYPLLLPASSTPGRSEAIPTAAGDLAAPPIGGPFQPLPLRLGR